MIQVRVKVGVTVVMETWARVRSYVPDSDDLSPELVYCLPQNDQVLARRQQSAGSKATRL